jgi:hypothetical protein
MPLNRHIELMALTAASALVVVVLATLAGGRLKSFLGFHCSLG